MISGRTFREIVSGRRSGPVAALLRRLLRAAEIPYASAMRFRNRRYDTGKSIVHKIGVPVVSVGNITLGGTGKTPMVEWIARWFRKSGVRVSIVSRGYRAEEGGRNDEARELEQKLPDVPHLQNPDRVSAAKIAVEELETQLIVLDDGFQHRRLARDLDIVLLDALDPFGLDHVFPRGMLREPLSGLRRADIIVLSRVDVLDAAEKEKIKKRVELLSPNAVLAEAKHAAVDLISAAGTCAPLEFLKNRPIAAFCGLGNPAGFIHTAKACGYNLLSSREFPDHHCYSRNDLEDLVNWAESAKAEAILCTHKDLVKIGMDRLGKMPLFAIRVGIEFLSGQEVMENFLKIILSQIDIG
jgi:tetraacyldisaccharide 4'-kinase